jgi:hypothetical protein
VQYSKAVYKKMKELSGKAYERELRGEMEKLAEQFQLWRDNQIDTWDLKEAVHKFHNGPARKLYGRYTDLSPEQVLPYALHKGLVAYEELPEEIIDEMRMKAGLYED